VEIVIDDYVKKKKRFCGKKLLPRTYLGDIKFDYHGEQHLIGAHTSTYEPD
jgi:hypothetical protein